MFLCFFYFLAESNFFSPFLFNESLEFFTEVYFFALSKYAHFCQLENYAVRVR